MSNDTLRQIHQRGRLLIDRPSAVKVCLLAAYWGFTLLALLPATGRWLPLLATLAVSSVALWFGPLGLIEPSGRQKWYDPATLFNSAAFYYCAKGITLATSTDLYYLRGMTYAQVQMLYPVSCALVMLGLLAWNLAYQVGLSEKRSELKRVRSYPAGDMFHSLNGTSLSRGVLLLSLVGVASLVGYFVSSGYSVPYLLAHPLSFRLGYTLPTGVRSPLAQLFRFGSYAFPVASLLWLTQLERQPKKVKVAWCAHATLGTFVYFVYGGRTDILGFGISVAVLAELVIRPIPVRWFIPLGLAGAAFAYLIHAWRLVTGTGRQTGIADMLSRLQSLLDLTAFAHFLSGTDLVDIRIYPLILYVYGTPFGGGTGLELGGTLLRSLSALIPRFLWPGKPVDLGLQIARLYEGTNAIAGTPPGFFPEMFMNFHIAGVIAGGALLGLALGSLYRECLKTRRGVIGAVVYAVVASRIPVIPSGTLGNIVVVLLILLSLAAVGLVVSGVHKVTYENADAAQTDTPPQQSA